jgi:phage anti-repressor protein
VAIGLFTDKEYQPTVTAVLEVLGTKRSLWEELTQFIADNYPIPGEWNFGGKNYGWNFWYRKSGKTLLTLYPQVGYFVAQIVLGKEQVEQALTLKLGRNVGMVLTETPQLHDGRWLFIKVKTKKDVKDIQQLLQVKRRPKPQT